MQTKIMTIFTRTPLHVGAGSSVGAVDQVVARERHTRFPVIPGSSLKGVLSDLWLEKDGEAWKRTAEGKTLFGEDDRNADAAAGKLLVGEGKLLAFPVRSAKGCFAWLTCPLALKRFRGDTGCGITVPDVVGEQNVLVTANSAVTVNGKVVLEEYPLDVAAAPVDASVAEAMKGLSDDAVWGEMASRLVVVSDELFAYFAVNACEIAAHNRIDDRTGTVDDGALFSQENVPSETLFYAVLNAKEAAVLDAVDSKIAENNHVLQIGADMTTGLGWCRVTMK